MEFLPQPLLTRDQVKLLKYDNVIHKDDKLMYLSTLGIVPKALEQIVPLYLRCYKKA
jgi:NADH dehydrogenase